jgi:hypothetical protein
MCRRNRPPAGEKRCPERGISPTLGYTRSAADENSLGKDGNGMPIKQTERRSGADPNGASIAAKNLSIVVSANFLTWISRMRSFCFNAVSRFFSFLGPPQDNSMEMGGDAGQGSNTCFTGVLTEKTSRTRTPRLRGAAKTIGPHRRHTCTSVLHSCLPSASRAQKSRMYYMISSGSISIVTQPT